MAECFLNQNSLERNCIAPVNHKPVCSSQAFSSPLGQRKHYKEWFAAHKLSQHCGCGKPASVSLWQVWTWPCQEIDVEETWRLPRSAWGKNGRCALEENREETIQKGDAGVYPTKALTETNELGQHKHLFRVYSTMRLHRSPMTIPTAFSCHPSLSLCRKRSKCTWQLTKSDLA